MSRAKVESAEARSGQAAAGSDPGWIPFKFHFAKKHAEADMNSTANGEITKLERELSTI